MTEKRKMGLYLFFCYSFLVAAAFDRGLFVLFLSENGYDSWHISFLQITLFGASILFNVPTGILADKYGRKLTLLAGTLLLSVSAAGQYWSGPQFLSMLFFFGLQGAAFAILSGSNHALLFDHLRLSGEPESYLKHSSTIRFLGSISLGLSILAGGALHSISWFWVYIGTAAIVFLSFLFLLFVPDRHKESMATAKPPSISLGKLALGTWKLLPVILPFSLMHAAMTPYFVYSQKIFEFQKVSAGAISSIIAASEIIGSLLVFGVVSTKLKLRLKSLAIPLLALFSLLLFLNFFNFRIISIFSLLASTAVVLLLQAISVTYVQDRIVDSSLRASTLSAMTFLDSIAVCLSYLLFGFLFDHYNPAMAVAWTSILPACSVLIFWIRKEKI